MKSRREYPRAALWLLAAALLLAGASALAQTAVEDLVPTVQCGYPNLAGSQSAKFVPPTFNCYVEGVDPDDKALRPWKYRFLWIPAVTPDGDPILTRYVYEAYRDELITWDRPDWSPWLEFPESGEDPTITFPALADGDAFLLALQVMDRDGAVSTRREYQREVANVKVSSLAFYPTVTLNEFYLGTAPHPNPSSQIACGQPLNFRWIADASAYNGEIVAYRHGWDLVDIDDVNDPGWAVPPGLAPENLFAEERVFQSGGIHVFTLSVLDDSGIRAVYNWTLEVIPFVPLYYQRPLLVIDQVVDDNTGRWVSETGVPLDREQYRNEYWSFLDGPDGVAGFDWERDRVDHTEAGTIGYADIVGYRTVLCYARIHSDQYLLSDLRAWNDVDPYVWLTPYQWRGGNFFLAGNSSMDSFLEPKPNYWVPTIFESVEPDVNDYELSFGWVELPDGSVVARGPRMYPCSTAGIAALDWSTSGRKTAWGRVQTLLNDRKPMCAGIKGLALDEGFRSRHGVGTAIADSIYTNALIDWQDVQAEAAGELELTSSSFPFTDDEFVDANITARTTPLVPQSCDGSPTGRCVEPMFTGIARYDYVREAQWAAGNTGWPYNAYVDAELTDLCGQIALEEYAGLALGSARTNGRTYGYLSYKMVDEKPSGKADVYWGFDPYRFDPEQTRQAVRWVLEYFGLEMMN